MSIQRRGKENNYYHELQESSREMLQHLSGDIWTDFNVHDPGLTISDFLNYALYELHYTYSSPFESYLSGNNPEVDYISKGIFNAATVFAPSIVTEKDYEVLILSAFEDISSCHVALEHGQYRITVKPKKGLSEENKKALRADVLRFYHAHRNLCEDVYTVKVSGETEGHGGRAYSGIPEHEKIPKMVTFPKMPEAYRSIQLDFPENYGLSKRGIPDRASETYKAQVMQLKAYLLIFDYMIADAAEQAATAHELFELSGRIPVTQTAEIDIPGIKQLVDERIKEATSKGRSGNWLNTQKARYLDLLDNFYGERTAPFFKRINDDVARNAHRANLIRVLPQLNANRFRSFDLHDPLSVPSIKQLWGAIHGNDVLDEIPVLKSLEDYGLRLVSDEEFFAQYHDYLSIGAISGIFYTPFFSDKFEQVRHQKTTYEKSDFQELKSKIILLGKNAISESFLLHGITPQQYRMVHLTETNVYLLLFQYPGKKEWMKLGTFNSEHELVRIANLLWEFLRQFDPERQSFYVIEHVMLKTGHSHVQAEDQYKLSIVLHGTDENRSKELALGEFLRERLPAHLDVTIFRIELDRLFNFEEIYFGWRKALKAGGDKAVNLSMSVRIFLEKNADYSTNLYE